MACAADPYPSWDVLAGSADAAKPPAAASAAVSTAVAALAAVSCCLSGASCHAAAPGFALRFQSPQAAASEALAGQGASCHAAAPGTAMRLRSPRASASEALASQGGPGIDFEAVHWGISEARRGLREAAAAAEAAQHAKSVGNHTSEVATSGRRLIAALLKADVPTKLLVCLGSLGFEAQKDAARLFADVLQHALLFGAGELVVAYFRSHPQILHLLVEGCANPCIFAHCAQMLRDCTWHPELVTDLLNSGATSSLIELAQNQNAEISLEAFATLRELILAQGAVAAPILSADFENFFADFHVLLGPDMEYIVRRQALRLLGEVLLDGAYQAAMLAYVVEDRFLRMHMDALRDDSRAIRLGSFHLFKIFVANPCKPVTIHSILYRNQGRLVKLVQTLSEGWTFDVNLSEDLGTVIRLLDGLEAPPLETSLL